MSNGFFVGNRLTLNRYQLRLGGFDRTDQVRVIFGGPFARSSAERLISHAHELLHKVIQRYAVERLGSSCLPSLWNSTAPKLAYFIRE